MDNLIIEDIIQKENIPFYQYSEFENVKLIGRNVYKVTFKTSQEKLLLLSIKRHRKFEINDSILKFYGITRQENTNNNNYMIILKYVNEGSLRQYLKTYFKKWIGMQKKSCKTIANNSESILIHNGDIKLNSLGLADSLRFLTNNLDTIQYMDPQHLELFSTIGKNKSSDIFKIGIILWEISNGNPPFEMESLSNIDFLNNMVKEKREMTISGTPQKYEEIYTDCWKHNGNSRPNISQVAKNFSEIIIPDASVEFKTQSQPYNDMDEIITLQLEKSNKQNRNSKLKSDPPFIDASVEAVVFIKDMFDFFLDIPAKQGMGIQPKLLKNYIREQKKNPAKILFEMIRYPSHYWFTSLIGFFYQHGIGTVVDNQMAFKFFYLAVDTKNTYSSLLIRKFFADEGSHVALNCMGYCYENGHEKGNLVAQYNVDICYENGIGIAIDETKAFQCKAFKWYLKAAEKGYPKTQYNVGNCYKLGCGINRDKVKAFKCQYMIGKCSYEGYWIKKDIINAIHWLNKAKEDGNTSANELLEEIISNIM
ncbi:hypothetical protein Glove_275g51 [Diversispora epigaea]|uniref:Protein kinase domain-containing protein n=1 Tax=Diversispora epigaea TaxID=1348612 RepID=A0A397IB63_9GLOM|nr:hypothetical protein Glove_275g51 [Diversispora epigaea]